MTTSIFLSALGQLPAGLVVPFETLQAGEVSVVQRLDYLAQTSRDIDEVLPAKGVPQFAHGLAFDKLSDEVIPFDSVDESARRPSPPAAGPSAMRKDSAEELRIATDA